MSCDLGRGYGGNCPVCSDEPEMEQCNTCNGLGYIFYDEDGKEVTEQEYNEHPDIYEKERCHVCDGEEQVEVEELDPSDYFYDRWKDDKLEKY